MANDGKGFKDIVSDTGKQMFERSGFGQLASTAGRVIDRLSGKKPQKYIDPNSLDAFAPFTGADFVGDKEFRAIITVPVDMLGGTAFGADRGLPGQSALYNLNGIYFPYTPTISQEYSASYNTLNPTHSNYSLYFYKHSTPGPITVSGKFTVQNDDDAHQWLGTMHLLRALTKMRFGTDVNAGAPPPVCRFSAFGDLQYKNVPVVIQSFKIDLPDSVDYYATKQEGKGAYDGIANMVPTSSALTVTLLPMYSRQELLGVSHVNDYVNGSPNLRQRGYL
jgi:hypothetical protein